MLISDSPTLIRIKNSLDVYRKIVPEFKFDTTFKHTSGVSLATTLY